MKEKDCEISEEDLRAALRELNTFIDVTEEDLKKIYTIALRHAREKLASKIPVSDVMTREVISVKKMPISMMYPSFWLLIGLVESL